MIQGRYCKRCKSFYDIGINFDECPNCRKELNKEVEDDGRKIN